MTNLKNICLVALAASALFSCKKNDDDSVPLREYSEVAAENDQTLQKYLSTHFCTLNPDKSVTLGTIEGTNAGKTPLSQQVKKKVIKVMDAHGDYIDHTMYYLILQEGSGEQATVADRSYVSYKGMTLEGKIFDQTIGNDTSNWLDLLGSQSGNNRGTIVGMREAVALLKTSSQEITINPDGTLSLPNDYGIGVFFMPAGISYFTGTNTTPQYAPLVFEVGLIRTQRADHDKDGIPSIEEIIHQPDGIIQYPDCNKNYTPDYLDAKPCK